MKNRSETMMKILTMLLAAVWLSSCADYDDSTSLSARKGVRLTFNVSTGNRHISRMPSEVTQNSGNYRGIQYLRLFPFKKSEIEPDDTTLSAPITQMTQHVKDDFIYYYDEGSRVPVGTKSFLCYCKASPLDGYTSKFENGALTTTIDKVLDWSSAKASAIEFDPVPIYTETEVAEVVVIDDKEVEIRRVKTDEKATALAAYLTGIANAKPEEEGTSWSDFSQSEAQGEPTSLTALRKLFHQFVNEGHPIACSSEYAEKWVNWLYAQLQDINPESGSKAANLKTAIITALQQNGGKITEGKVTFPTSTDANPQVPDLTGYPANISLPDGAAVVQWNPTTKLFTAQVQTTTTANVNSLNRFAYPPELYYYTSSGIRISHDVLLDELNETSWDEVLSKFESGPGTVDGGVSSIAISDPLAYAVGCLQLGFYIPFSSLPDAEDRLIPLSPGTSDNAGTFPLSAILISNQYPQDYKFEPQELSDEYIIYDKEMPTTIISNKYVPAIQLGSSTTPTPADDLFTNTLALQTKDGAPVRFAMEFTNNSGVDFQGINGTVFQGTKFYLVGQIKVPEITEDSKDYEKRVFTKNHTTKGVITISSLKDAYPYLPDLLDPRLEIGIQLVPDWIQVTTTNVPL